MATNRRRGVLAVWGGLLAICAPAWASAADVDPPRIVHVPVTEAVRGAPLEIVAEILDESDIFEPRLHYRVAGSRPYLTTSMMRGSGARFSATIPDSAVAKDLEYFIDVYDSQGNGPSLFASEAAPQLVVVKEAPAGAEAAGVAATPPEKAKASVSGPPAASPVLPPPPPPERRPATSTRRIAGLALVGAGVLVAAGGAVAHVLSEEDWARATKLAEEGRDRAAFEQAKSDSDAKLVAAGVLYAAGGACAIAGAVLALTAPSASPAAEVSVRPAAGPGGFSVLVEGRF